MWHQVLSHYCKRELIFLLVRTHGDGERYCEYLAVSICVFSSANRKVLVKSWWIQVSLYHKAMRNSTEDEVQKQGLSDITSGQHAARRMLCGSLRKSPSPVPPVPFFSFFFNSRNCIFFLEKLNNRAVLTLEQQEIQPVMWRRVADFSAGSKAPCEAHHGKICQCSARNRRCLTAVERSRAGLRGASGEVGSGSRSSVWRKTQSSSAGCWESRVLAVKLRHQSLPVPRKRRVLGEEGTRCVPWLFYRSRRKREFGR